MNTFVAICALLGIAGMVTFLTVYCIIGYRVLTA